MKSSRALALLALLSVACGNQRPLSESAAFLEVEEGAGEPVRPTEPAEPAEPAPPPPPKHPFLWVVEGGPRPSYVLGIIGAGVGLADVLTDEQRVWIELSDALILRLDPHEPVRADQIPSSYLRRGQSLRRILSTRAWARLREELPNLPEEELDKLRPWMAHLLWGQFQTEMQLARMEHAQGGAPIAPIGMGPALYAEAAGRGQEMVFLETFRDQSRMIGRLSDSDFAAWFERWLFGNGRPIAERIEEHVQTYRTGDERGMEEQIFVADPSTQERTVRRQFLDGRVRDWVPTIARQMRERGVFVAVDIQFVLGEHGIVSELSRRGLTLRRVSPQ
ncbi:MAG: TraB/GumN family protein [Myxococcales bacterium]|nr:TraB/GumN family protein [Myxococcales bacterium]